MGKYLNTGVTLLFFMIFLSVNSLSFSQKLTDTLKISAVKIYAIRPVESTGLSRTKLDSLILKEKVNTNLAETMSEHSHVFIKTYGRGALASASFRGTAPSHTKVIWNGIELNSPLTGMVDFSLIPMFFIDNIELYHGSSSISKTTGALGGLVNLSTTTDWKKNFSGMVQQGLGSFGSFDEYIKMEVGDKRFRSKTRLFYVHSDNDYKYLNTDVLDSVNLESGRKYHPVMRNTDAWFTNYGLLQEFYYRPTEKDFVSFNLWGHESSRSIPQLSTNEAGLNNNINRDNTRMLIAVLSYKRYISSGQFNAFSGLNYSDNRYTLINRIQDELMINEINSNTCMIGNYNHFEYSFEKNGTLLNISSDINIFKVRSFENVQGFGYDKSRFHPSLSASFIKKWDKRWRSNITLASEMVDEDLLPLLYNTALEFHILPEDELYLRASIAGNSKYPSLNDMYFQPGGNPLLKPERSFNQEIGIHHKIQIQRISIENDLGIYNSAVNDWILWLPTFKGYWVPGNIKKVISRGLETNLSLSMDEGLIRYKVKVNYALTRSRNRGDSENPSDISFDRQLPFIPVHSANFFGILMYKTWSVSYLWNYYSQRHTTTSNQINSSRDYLYPYFMNQVGINKQLSGNKIRAEINFKINNLFNEKYRSILQRPMPGRNYAIQVRLSF